MPTNISKYVQLNDFLLLEYEFNRDGSLGTLTTPFIAETSLGSTIFYEGDAALGKTNNILALNSVPTNAERTGWVIDSSQPWLTYSSYWETSVGISTTTYPLDTVKIHIVSGYAFEDVGGFLLQIQAEDNLTNLKDLTNFTYIKQPQALDSNVIKFATNTLFLGNRFYDKYVELSIPSIQKLSSYKTNDLENTLNIKPLSDVFVTYSTIYNIVNDNYFIDEQIKVQLPVTSAADNFNCFIAESTDGDYIEYFAMWQNTIIGDYIGDIESGRIQLYTSNNPNDNYDQFTQTYGQGSPKWVLIHEIAVFEHIPGGTSLLTQSYSFTQTNNFSVPNFFRPILRNADIDSSYSIQYTCRLMNRMDGTQIIRKASFSSSDPKKYGLYFTRLNVDNLIPYKVFNRIEAEMNNSVINSGLEKIKYVKVFFDTVTVVLNASNEVFVQGTGPLFLKDADAAYKFKFGQITITSDNQNVDLSGAYNYALLFKLDDNTKIQIGPTYSTNMNTTIGEIEFKITEDQSTTLQKQVGNSFSIVVLNPDGTQYTFYQGVYYPLSNQADVIANYQSLVSVTDLQAQIATLQTQVNDLTAKNAALSTK
jgi:hypothetical protein